MRSLAVVFFLWELALCSLFALLALLGWASHACDFCPIDLLSSGLLTVLVWELYEGYSIETKGSKVTFGEAGAKTWSSSQLYRSATIACSALYNTSIFIIKRKARLSSVAGSESKDSKTGLCHCE